MLLGMLSIVGGVQAAPRDSYSSQVSSVSYPRATLYSGLTQSDADRVGTIVNNRLASSSMRTVNAAAAIWAVVAESYGWPGVIQTDDLERGGKLAAFVLHMVDRQDLVGDSIASYVWGLRWYMKLNRQADPAMGVMNWHDFMTSIKVLTHVPHEPRRAVPLELIYRMAEVVDLSSFEEVQGMFLTVLLLFTFSRSECPCPKAFTGEGAWDDDKHWMVRDIVIRMVAGVWVLCVRFKAIKQDPRIERPEARGDGTESGAAAHGGADWVYVGDCPGSDLSPFTWYRRLMTFYEGPREPTEPFFMARDRQRPYTYSAAMATFRRLIAKVQEDIAYGLHGLRVEGYNQAKRASGETVAVAQGGWKPGSNSRYERFNLRRDVFPLAALMVAHPPDGGDDDDDNVELTEVAVPGSPHAQVPPEPPGDQALPSPHMAAATRIAAQVVLSPPIARVTRAAAAEVGEPTGEPLGSESPM